MATQGLKISDQPDSELFLHRVVEWNGFTIDQIKSKRASESADFSVAAVSKDGVRWWDYKIHHPTFMGFAFLMEVEGEYVIALCHHFKVEMVIPILDMTHHQQLANHEYVGGRNIKEIIRLKEIVAGKLQKHEPAWSNREQQMINRRKSREQSERNKEKAARAKADEEARAKAEAEKLAIQAKIKARGTLRAFTTNGRQRSGYPVVGEEWQNLNPDVGCISVTSYDDTTGTMGELIEAFFTGIKKGKKRRNGLVTVTKENPLAPKLLNLQTTVMAVDDEDEEVLIAPDMQTVQGLRDRKLNHGTYVLAPEEGTANRFTLYQLKGDEIITVKTVARKTAQQ